jgi:hypothetical protein
VPSIGVLDLQNNHLKDPEVLDILAAMPNLKVLLAPPPVLSGHAASLTPY